MTSCAIRVEDLWKEYTVGAAQQAGGTFYDLLSDALTAPLRRLRGRGAEAEPTQFWALRGVDFEIQPGEVFGVVGRNGAGKSTLLKILSRITAPTRGRITVKGRIASLLEVGTGFHPELTGRENIFLNATILGMTQKEVARKLDAIVAFSGVEAFLDTPVKRYSSGMYVRLAFAVAAHVEADILLVDEVLAVGDADFQKRCLGMMGDVARGGRTVIFVSHNLTALRNLCGTGMLLANGQMSGHGKIGAILEQYASSSMSAGNIAILPVDRNCDRAARVLQISVVRNGHDEASPISVDSGFNINTRIEVRERDAEVAVFLSCFDATQTRVFSTASFFETRVHESRSEIGTYEFLCTVPPDLLNEGEYTLDIALVRNRSEVIVEEPTVLSFRVAAASIGIEGWNWPVLGVVRPKLAWSQRRLDRSIDA